MEMQLQSHEEPKAQSHEDQRFKKKKALRADSIGSRRREVGDPKERTASMYREKRFGLLWATPSTSHLATEPGKNVPSNQTPYA